MAGLPRVLLFIWLAIISVAFVAEQAVNFRDLLGMNVPIWFWETILSAMFVTTVIGVLLVQEKQIGALSRQAFTKTVPDDKISEANQPGQTAKPPDLREQIRIKLDAFIHQGNDLLLVINRGSEWLSDETIKAVHRWGYEIKQYFIQLYPGRAAEFVDHLPRHTVTARAAFREYLERCLLELDTIKKDLASLKSPS